LASPVAQPRTIQQFGSPTGEAAFRAAVGRVDCALGTPPLLVGGLLAWLRRPTGYAITAGLVFVSGLGDWPLGPILESLLSGGVVEWAVVAVHFTICAVSFGLLAWFLIRDSTILVNRTGRSIAKTESARWQLPLRMTR